MKIAIDLQGYQSRGNRTRGIGRYSYALIRTLIENSTANDTFILVANKSLDKPDKEFYSFIQTNIDKVQYFEWTCPEFIEKNANNHNINSLIAQQLRSYAFSLLNCDVILITSFFEGFKDNAVLEVDDEFNLPPLATIFYDLIPLINPERYLDLNPPYKEFYMKRIHHLNKVDCILSISKSSAQEACQYLSIDTEKIYNIYAGCDRNLFKPSHKTKGSSNFKNIKIGEYILYSGAGDPRKNLQRLIHSYSLLDKKLILTYKLVLVGKLLPEEISLIKSWIFSYNLLESQVILLGYVSDEELADLYRNCKLFIFPSLHEGFGLPALEAMSCGAAVLASNYTSIPEIIQNQDALFDPTNLPQITSLITKALTNESFFDSLSKTAFQKSLNFSWDKTADITKKALLNTIKNSNKAKRNHFTEDLIIDLKNKNYNLMLEKIASILEENKSLLDDDIYLKELAASINLIELNSSYFKQFSIDNNFISSWQIEGPFDSNYSLAILNREFALALKKKIPNTTILSTEGPGDYEPDLNFLRNHSDIFKLYKDSIEKVENGSLVVSRNLYPPRVNDLFSRINMLHAYGWEESELPQDWINDFNQYLDGITVMSSQVRKTLIDCGFKKPIHVCGLGVDHLNRSLDIKKIDLAAKKFKFLHISSCFPRKGINCLLEAYGKAYTADDEVTLIVKTFSNPHNEIHELVKKYQKSYINYPHIIILEKDFSLAEIRYLYSYSDAYVAPSHGEGFGLPLAEAMLFSLPVITTSWGGQVDFSSNENSWLIDFDFEYSKTHFEQFDSVWALPSSDDLAEKMKEIRLISNEDIKSKVDKARTHILNNFSWENVVSKNINFVNKLLNFKPSLKSKIAFLTTWNTKCGIASYASNLVDYIEEETYILAPNDSSLTYEDRSNVFRCWDINQSFNEKITNTILKLNISTIVIQFNYGFFDFNSFNQFINFLFVNKIKIIIFFHSTRDPIHDKNKALNKIQNSLMLADRLMVHTCSDLNRLKRINLIHNVSIFPHGIKDFVKKDTDVSQNLIVPDSSKVKPYKYKFATTGYCLPNKGFLELIRSISILVEKNCDVHLTLFTPSYDINYEFYLEKIKELISDLNLNNFVKLDTTYYEESKIFTFLSEMDLVIYPYQQSNESSSASVRQGIASGAEVIVTPISIFEDVNKVVTVFPGITSEQMAVGLENWINNKNKNEVLNINNTQSSKLDLWREDHRFSKLARRLSSIITSIEVNSEFNSD
tara:strand:+ start:566 stop:4273 length:3708 start_codon:yes stop_codon:yes gene_type:complete